jgi:hypothetical protein
MILIILTYR